MPATVTDNTFAFHSSSNLVSGAALGNYYHFTAVGGTTTGATITNQFGFTAGSGLTAATNNYGFYSNISSTAGRWNFYANGTAKNYFAGNTLFGSNNQDAIIAGTAAGMYTTSQGVIYKARTETDERYQIAFHNGNGEVGTIKTDGNATSYNTSSDYRLKENVVPMTAATDRVKALKPCRFNFKSDATKTVDGFIGS